MTNEGKSQGLDGRIQGRTLGIRGASYRWPDTLRLPNPVTLDNGHV